MIILFANNAKTTLASALTSASTTLSVYPGTGNLFPSPSSGQYFILTLTDAATGLINEIVWVTGRTADVLTIIRAQEGTIARSWLLGDFTSCFPTAGTQASFVQPDQFQQGTYEYAVAGGTANALTASVTSNLTSFPDGMPLSIRALTANTGATTLQITLVGQSGNTILSAWPIVKGGNQTLVAGDIPSFGYPLQLNWSSTFNSWVQQNPATGISVIPVGSIYQFPCTTAPNGFLIANGQLLSRVSYPNLYAFAVASGNIVSDSSWSANNQGAFSSGDGSTTFRIPQFGGYFLRSLDNGNGIDPSRTIGTVQAGQNQIHSHGASSASSSTSTVSIYDPGHAHSSGPGFGNGNGNFFVNGIGGLQTPNIGGIGGQVPNTGLSTTQLIVSVGTTTTTTTTIANSSGASESRPINVSVLTCIKY